MNLLFLTSRFPYPPYRGDKLKILNLIKQLSKRHHVTLLSFIASNDELQHVPEPRQYYQQVKLLEQSVRQLDTRIRAKKSQ